MELHEQVSVAIAATDLRYVVGSALSAAAHPRSWPMLQWGTMVTYEAQKNIHDVHEIELEFDWEDDIAAAARHGGKFFDVRAKQFDSVVTDFRELVEATHAAFYPDDRPGRGFDFLRDDLSVISDGSELLLTNVTGHFMAGLPPHRGIDMNSWGPHMKTLASGIGQLASILASESVGEFSMHGNHSNTGVAWVGREDLRGDSGDLRRRTHNRARTRGDQHLLDCASRPTVGKRRVLRVLRCCST